MVYVGMQVCIIMYEDASVMEVCNVCFHVSGMYCAQNARTHVRKHARTHTYFTHTHTYTTHVLDPRQREVRPSPTLATAT